MSSTKPRILLSDNEQTYLTDWIKQHKPLRVLEIGTGFGGSAWLMSKALPRGGELITVDNHPQPEAHTVLAKLKNVTLIEQSSPVVIEGLAGKFDLIFIDGDHSYEGVLKDIRGCVPLLAPHGSLLFHDVYHEPVNLAVEAGVKEFSLEDHGFVTSDCSTDEQGNKWGGFRLCSTR